MTQGLKSQCGLVNSTVKQLLWTRINSGSEICL